MSVERLLERTRRAGAALATPAAAGDAARRRRVCTALLAAAVVVYAAVALYATRGIVPYLDGMAWFLRASDGLSIGALLEPHNGHLIAVTRVQYWLGLQLFGSDGWVPLLFQIGYVAASALLLNALLRRRVDPLLALLPSVLLLFAGSMTVLIDPNVAVFAQSTAFGLGALLALERRTPRADALACGLLALGLAAFSLGVAFAVGAGVMVASRAEGRRWWVVVAPLLGYAAWALWARSHFDDGSLEFGGAGPGSGPLSNLLLAPTFALDSLAAALAAAAGLGRELAGISNLQLISINWGRVLAFALIALLLARGTLRRRPEGIAVAIIPILLVDWTLGALNFSLFRPPDTERYAFPAVALIMLLLAACFPGGARIGTRAALAALAVLLFALPGNLFALRLNAANIRDTSAIARAQLTAAEIASDAADPEARIGLDLFGNVRVGRFADFDAAHPGLPYEEGELAAQPERVREAVDGTLGGLLGIDESLRAPSIDDAECSAPAAEAELPVGGGVVLARRSQTLRLRRFASEPTVQIPLAGRSSIVLVPVDRSSAPWFASATGGRAIRVCPLQAGDAP